MQGSKNQWQVVGKAKKPTPAKGKADQGQPSAKSAASVSVDPAFAVLDREWNAKKLAAAQQSTYSDALPDSSSDVDDDQPQPATSPASKKRRPPKKTKKPKIAEVAAQIIADGSLHATLDDIASKYTEDASARAEALAAYMQRTFELCELAFNKLLLADPRRAAGEPITQLDDACARPVRALLQGVALTDAGVLTISLLDAIVRGQPDTPQGGAAPPKAQVGLLLSMALLAQAHPSALLVASAHIEQGGQKYASPGRAPLLLWTFDQFARASKPACAAAYTRVALPQLLAGPLGPPGPRLPAAAQAMLASYAQDTLLPAADSLVAAAPKGVVDAHGHATAIITTHAFEILQRAVSQHPSPALQQQLLLWRCVIAASAPVADLPSLIRASLDAAAAAVASDGQHAPLVAAVAATLAACCAAHLPCFEAWVGRHKTALRGSTAVLAHLATHPATCAPLRTPRATAARFSATLKALQARHQQQLAAGKGWQGAAAASAESACNTLLGGRAMRSGGRRTPEALSLWLLLLLLPAAAVLMRHDARVRGLAVQWLGPAVLPAADAAFDVTVGLLESHAQRVWDACQPHVQRVWVVVEPHVRRLLVLAEPTVGLHAA